MSYRFSLLIVGMFGISGVGLGAFGAHLLHDQLAQHGTISTWSTAVNYHLIHTVALLALVLVQFRYRSSPSRWLMWTTRLWMTGILLFSGSLYFLAMGGPKFLGPVTPLGGLSLILGWGFVMLEALNAPEKAEP